jgi:hypothetical protein
VGSLCIFSRNGVSTSSSCHSVSHHLILTMFAFALCSHIFGSRHTHDIKGYNVSCLGVFVYLSVLCFTHFYHFYVVIHFSLLLITAAMSAQTNCQQGVPHLCHIAVIAIPDEVSINEFIFEFIVSNIGHLLLTSLLLHSIIISEQHCHHLWWLLARRGPRSSAELGE